MHRRFIRCAPIGVWVSLAFLVALSLCWGMVGCASELAVGERNDRLTSEGAMVGAGTSGATAPSSTIAASSDSPEAFPGVFTDVARALAPRSVYGLARLPRGAQFPVAWWPVLQCSEPAEYQGPYVPNPRISGTQEVGQEAQVVMRLPEGWIVFLENFRGDLGDVAGDPVGVVAGHPATLHLLNEAVVVQWSDERAWFAVVGRGIAPQHVVEIALDMEIVSVNAGKGGEHLAAP